MGRKPPQRSKPSRLPRSPTGGEHKGERARLRRNRPLTWRSALLWLVPLALLTAGTDVALYVLVKDHYARHGHVGVPLDLGAAALGFTALTVYGCVAVRNEVRKGSGGSQAIKPPTGAAQNRHTKEQL